MKVEFQECNDSSFFETDRGIKDQPKVYHVKDDGWYLRCYACGDILSIRKHAELGLIHVENGVVDIRGGGSHSIGEHGRVGNEICHSHYHIYNGEIVLA